MNIWEVTMSDGSVLTIEAPTYWEALIEAANYGTPIEAAP